MSNRNYIMEKYNLTDSNPNKYYLCSSGYGATGEGITTWVSIEYGKNPEEVKEKFLAKFGLQGYPIGVATFDFEDKETVRAGLLSYFNEEIVDAVMKDTYAYRQFRFEYNVNFS